MVPSLLLLVARDLLVHDPPRILAWRLLHHPGLAALPSWLATLLPRTTPEVDRDPLALLLGAIAVGLAAAYLAAALAGARTLVRGAIVALGSLALVVAPTVAFVAMGFATDRPYGQDGGVVQLPLAIDKILAGESPYGADYSDSILGKESRASQFWALYGGNPILRHHAYLPGTHLLTMPFQLASRALFGAFDPRGVSLLAYLLAILLAVRLVDGAPRRLSAAAIVALNPLAYWYQIFGANDVLFAALVLWAVWLADRGRAGASGALLGLACATKQLAWPFAPFLLLHLSGAKSLRDLLGREALGRLARPALAAVGVFAAVVLPVAGLDFRAFYRDIVVYNVGLPGGDNYPLGGTPGFGFANFLIYFGRVSSLRDYFPFGVFYVVLLPLGLLLARAQLRAGRASFALLTGATAYVAALYFSRVVHPNYVIGVAVLLPVALLAACRPADLAVAPLLLLGLATAVVEQEVFRATWDHAVNVRLPAHLTGLAAAVAPRGGPHLTLDPIGVGVSAVAAGLGVAYLVAAALGASPRVRAGLAAAAVVCVVGVPALVVAGIGKRTGTPRGQDAWIVQVPADAARVARGASPYAPPREEGPLGREAWSTSFRLDPPRILQPDRPAMPPGAAVLGALLRPLGLRDPRMLSLAALALLLAALSGLVRSEERPLALAASALAPFLASGVAFGAPDVLTLGALAAALAVARAGRSLAAGLLAGLAAAVDARALLVAPFLANDAARAGCRFDPRRAGAGLAGAFAVVILPVALLDVRAFAAAMGAVAGVAPGVGLANLFVYGGAQDTVLAHALFALLPSAVVALAATLAWRGRGSEACPLGAAALVSLVALFVAREASPEALAVPATLLVLAAVSDPGPPSG